MGGIEFFQAKLHQSVISTESEEARLRRATEEEWRDPEDVSLAMQTRGVLPTLLVAMFSLVEMVTCTMLV